MSWCFLLAASAPLTHTSTTCLHHQPARPAPPPTMQRPAIPGAATGPPTKRLFVQPHFANVCRVAPHRRPHVMLRTSHQAQAQAQAQGPPPAAGCVPSTSAAQVLVEDGDGSVASSSSPSPPSTAAVQLADQAANDKRMLERAMRRKTQRSVYLWAAIASSVGFSTLAAGAVYYRFVWQMQGSDQVPYLEVLGTFSLAVGAAVGMEFWARWAHKALWHASLWSMHESHHRPREGPFELNDVFAIINAVPAIALLAYGFFNAGLVPGLCFGAGLGITMFGMAYMFIHDGLVHRRFPVGPIADVPYLQKVAAAHQLHHADKFEGVPYGLFLGPKELEKVGGLPELQAVMQSKFRGSKQSKSKSA